MKPLSIAFFTTNPWYFKICHDPGRQIATTVVTVPGSQTKLPEEVHQLPACDAVIVGGNTLRQDNLSPTSRQAEAHSPWS